MKAMKKSIHRRTGNTYAIGMRPALHRLVDLGTENAIERDPHSQKDGSMRPFFPGILG